MLRQTLAHTLVRFAIAVFRAPVVASRRRFHAFIVHGIASTAAVEHVQGQELASVQGRLLEHNCGTQHAVDWPVFKFVEACVILH